MAASIRSLRNGTLPVDNASRNDIVVGDVVGVSALAPATSYAWVLSFVPDGSTATFSGSATAVSPGTFTVDLPGPYLVRLTTDVGLPTESTQYVRLRVLTPTLNLRLIAAGERRDASGIIPVDASPEGWANDQNYNLQTLEAAIISPPGTGINGFSLPFDVSTPSPAIVCPLAAAAYVIHTRVFIAVPFDDPAATIEVGVTAAASVLQAAGDNDPATAGTYISDETYPSSGLTNIAVTLNPAASTVGSGVVIVLVHNP
jgi:hypothetical protein